MWKNSIEQLNNIRSISTQVVYKNCTVALYGVELSIWDGLLVKDGTGTSDWPLLCRFQSSEATEAVAMMPTSLALL